MTASTGGAERVLELPVAVEVVRNGLAAVADEMAITEVRTAYSTVVRDMLDFSTAVCDAEGRVLSQGLTLALQLGAIPRFMRALLDQIGTAERGDVWVANDPWHLGTHLPDLFFTKPVYLEGEAAPIAYATIVSHVIDIGGNFPGGIAVEATSLWQEGLLVPPTRIVRAGKRNEEVLRLIAANTRDPAKVLGDIRSVLAALETGAEQVRDLAARLGAADLRRFTDELLDNTERATRAALARIPDGVGEATDHLDDDGVGGPPIVFHCRVEKRGEHLSFDFTGTGEQVPSAYNTTLADVASVVTFAARAALGEDLAVNDGFNRCIDFEVPEGTIVNARPKSAVNSRAASVYRLTDVALAALSRIAERGLPANDGGPGVVYLSGEDAERGVWIFCDYVQSGWGATPTHDGVAGASHPISNAANVPVEVAEEEYPVRIVEFGLLPGTAGAGTFVGSPSTTRCYEILADGIQLSMRLERKRFAPQGLAGGGAGAAATCQIDRGDGWEDVPAKLTTILDRGDRLRIALAAGGGWGPPGERSAAAQVRDRRNGMEPHDGAETSA